MQLYTYRFPNTKYKQFATAGYFTENFDLSKFEKSLAFRGIPYIMQLQKVKFVSNPLEHSAKRKKNLQVFHRTIYLVCIFCIP
jgi:hypothetical protein